MLFIYNKLWLSSKEENITLSRWIFRNSKIEEIRQDFPPNYKSFDWGGNIILAWPRFLIAYQTIVNCEIYSSKKYDTAWHNKDIHFT